MEKFGRWGISRNNVYEQLRVKGPPYVNYISVKHFLTGLIIIMTGLPVQYKCMITVMLKDVMLK